MSGLEERLQAAVGRELARHGGDQRQLIGVRAAIVAGLQVLAEEFGPRPEDAAPAARELPTEPGAVVLVPTDAGLRVALLDATEREWHYIDGSGFCVSVGGQWLGDWVDATVIPTATHGVLVQALHRIAHAEFDRKVTPEDIVEEHREVAAEALKRLEGEAT